jgi:hypothetical protein
MTRLPIPLRALRLSAKISSILAVGIVLLFLFGEGMRPARFEARDWVLFAFFPAGVCAGMCLAWRWEGLGGGITVASLVGFYAAHRLMSSHFPGGLAFVTLAAPGFMFFICWLWARSLARKTP